MVVVLYLYYLHSVICLLHVSCLEVSMSFFFFTAEHWSPKYFYENTDPRIFSFEV